MKNKETTYKQILALKPSKLVALALDDLKEVEKDSDYRVDMGFWHDPAEVADVCYVCFAGSVMAKSLRKDRRKRLYPSDFRRDMQCRMNALDRFRTGKINAGLFEMGISSRKFKQVTVADYDTNRPQFFKDMGRVVSKLRRAGL